MRVGRCCMVRVIEGRAFCRCGIALDAGGGCGRCKPHKTGLVDVDDAPVDAPESLMRRWRAADAIIARLCLRVGIPVGSAWSGPMNRALKLMTNRRAQISREIGDAMF